MQDEKLQRGRQSGKSQSGFDIGLKKSFGSFYSSLRERTEIEQERLHDLKNVTASQQTKNRNHPGFTKTDKVSAKITQDEAAPDVGLGMQLGGVSQRFQSKYYNCERMYGREFIQSLVKQQEDRYQKKLPFERGQYN